MILYKMACNLIILYLHVLYLVILGRNNVTWEEPT